MTLKVIHRLQAFSSAIRRTFVQHVTRFQLIECSHGSSTLAELLVIPGPDTRFQIRGGVNRVFVLSSPFIPFPTPFRSRPFFISRPSSLSPFSVLSFPSPAPFLGPPTSPIQLRNLGERCELPIGSGRNLADKRFLVHAELKVDVP